MGVVERASTVIFEGIPSRKKWNTQNGKREKRLCQRQKCHNEMEKGGKDVWTYVEKLATEAKSRGNILGSGFWKTKRGSSCSEQNDRKKKRRN